MTVGLLRFSAPIRHLPAAAGDGGLGARLKLRIGGKLGPSSGDPVDVEATVIGLSDQLANALSDMDGPLGTAAGIKVHLDDEASTAPGSRTSGASARSATSTRRMSGLSMSR